MRAPSFTQQCERKSWLSEMDVPIFGTALCRSPGMATEVALHGQES